MKPLIIVGAGMAGYTLAREVRKLDRERALLVITADGGDFYSKPMLSNAFAQGKDAAQLVSQSATQMAAQLGASILTRTTVEAIDTARKTVKTSAGEFEYEQLVLAVGAQPVRLALNGNASEEVVSVNHMDDYAGWRARMLPFGERVRITIIGAGLIGCEFADDLSGARHLGTLVDPNPLPLSALAPPALARGLASALQARGVVLRSGVTAQRIERASSSLQVHLSDGQVQDADLVLSAVGLRADLRLARESGLQTGRGITIDRHGMTSAPDVYALGDCAEYCNGDAQVCLPYIAPLMSAARAIARTLSGTPTAIDMKPTPVIVKTPSYPLALLPPPLGLIGHWETAQDGARTVSRFVDAVGAVHGFGVAPQDAPSRQALMAELGKPVVMAA